MYTECIKENAMIRQDQNKADITRNFKQGHLKVLFIRFTYPEHSGKTVLDQLKLVLKTFTYPEHTGKFVFHKIYLPREYL